jgi:hypothetical protein
MTAIRRLRAETYRESRWPEKATDLSSWCDSGPVIKPTTSRENRLRTLTHPRYIVAPRKHSYLLVRRSIVQRPIDVDYEESIAVSKLQPTQWDEVLALRSSRENETILQSVPQYQQGLLQGTFAAGHPCSILSGRHHMCGTSSTHMYLIEAFASVATSIFMQSARNGLSF